MVKEIITDDVRRCLYEDNTGAFVTGSHRAGNNISGMNQDETLESSIIRSMKALGFCKYEHFKNATYWLQTLSKAYNTLCRFAGGRMDWNYRHNDAGDDITVCLDEREHCVDGILKGYDRTGMKDGKVKCMVQSMRQTGHLGAEFLAAQLVSCYAPGVVVAVTDENILDKVINVHEVGS